MADVLEGLSVDERKGALIAVAEANYRKATTLEMLMVRAFGSPVVIFHLGYRHVLSRYRERYYHIDISKAT